jgi:hypothetical protein
MMVLAIGLKGILQSRDDLDPNQIVVPNHSVELRLLSFSVKPVELKVYASQSLLVLRSY